MSAVELVVRRVRDPRTDESMRVLVDRLWPRGVSKERADLDEWAKDAAPSTELRKEFHAGGMTFAAFTERYRDELGDGAVADGLARLTETVRQADGRVALLIASDPSEDNHAEILLTALRERLEAER